MEIRLTEDIERGLIEKANQLGKPPEPLALEVLRKQFARPKAAEASVTQAQTLADLLGDYIGAVDSGKYVEGGAQMSKDTGRKFAEGMVQKRENKTVIL